MSIDDTLREWSFKLKEQDKAERGAGEAARTEAIRSLCQGPPFLLRPYETDVPEPVLQAFEIDDPHLFVTVLRRSLDLMVKDQHHEALLWALGDYASHDTLTERRNDLMKKRDISYRTLVRHEQEGAAKLASLMMRIKDSEVADAPASPANMQYLQQRVNDLEAVVSALAGLSHKLLQLLDEAKPLDAQVLRAGLHWDRPDEESRERFDFAESRVMERATERDAHIHVGLKD